MVYQPFIAATGRIRWHDPADGTPRDLFVDASDAGQIKLACPDDTGKSPFVDSGGRIKFDSCIPGCADWWLCNYLIAGQRGASREVAWFEYAGMDGDYRTYTPVAVVGTCTFGYCDNTDFIAGQVEMFPDDCYPVTCPTGPASSIERFADPTSIVKIDVSSGNEGKVKGTIKLWHLTATAAGLATVWQYIWTKTIAVQYTINSSDCIDAEECGLTRKWKHALTFPTWTRATESYAKSGEDCTYTAYGNTENAVDIIPYYYVE